MDFWSDDEDKEKMSRSHVFFEVLLMEGSPHMHKVNFYVISASSLSGLFAFAR
jgi:hypothetical protein